MSAFCLPLGGQLSLLKSSTHDTHGKQSTAAARHRCVHHSSKRYSADCFVFVLDDKTVAPQVTDNCSDSHAQCPGQRLYGICVQQTRQLSVCCEGNRGSRHRSGSDTSSSTSISVDDVEGDRDRDRESRDLRPSLMMFESKVCFAFITRYPLIHFFFEVILEMLELDAEKGTMSSEGLGVAEMMLLFAEEYVPSLLLEEILARLIRIPPPRYGKSVQMSTSQSSFCQTVCYITSMPSSHILLRLRCHQQLHACSYRSNISLFARDYSSRTLRRRRLFSL